MKLSVLPVSLFSQLSSGEMPVAAWAEYAQELGADGFDTSILFYPNHTPTTLNKIKEELKGIQIQPVMVCCYPDFTNPDAMERERQIDYLKRDLALISDLGFQYVRITAGQNHPGLDIEEGAKVCAGCFEQMISTAEKYGVKMVFENHSKPGAWPLIDFSFRQEAFLAVFDKMKDLPVGINFDTANAVACGADPIKLLDQVIDKVWTVHLNDTATVGKWTPAAVGEGLVDFDRIFEKLNAHGFDNWVCIEEASGNGMEGIKNAVHFARKYVK
ncbi:sugar phosphate isomerase/epimerase family protein [Clostridium sp. MCC353]|uniref:sugar phosphate isomerase/epimerase family protein n=1 Tax=Clostridium sp. MCC353 TaxID=2592646 RepID=UPI001C01FEDD|nr:sugar phosphate isomerase/epimerase family protein [Clostridium sp. MCC353]